ncbi:MAG: FHA domain-containing protein, partial [Myxococcota bacterium]
TEKAGAAEENDDDWDPFDKAEAMSEAGMDWSQIGAEKPGATESPGPEQDSAEPEPEPAEVSQERVKTRVGEDEPAWVETDSPEKDVAPKPVMGEPTEVEPRKDVGPLLGSKRGSEGDYDRLLADLDDLETGARELSDEHVDKATDVAEARSRLLLAVEGGKSVEVLKTPFVIGRTRSCDLQIISERVSRTHAVIEADGPLGFKIVDKNSSNGLWIGRERIKEHALQDGDVFRVGDRRITAKIQVSTEAD